jgi:hypothetical protein
MGRNLHWSIIAASEYQHVATRRQYETPSLGVMSFEFALGRNSRRPIKIAAKLRLASPANQCAARSSLRRTALIPRKLGGDHAGKSTNPRAMWLPTVQV